MATSSIEMGVVIGSAVGIGVVEFFKLPVETRTLMCSIFPCMSIGVLGVFAYFVHETKRMAGRK